MDLETVVTQLDTGKSLMNKTRDELLPCLLQMTKHGCLITGKLLKVVCPVYIGAAFITEKAVLKYQDKVFLS